MEALRRSLRYWEDENGETEEFARCRRAELLCGNRAVLKTEQCLDSGSAQLAAQVAALVLAAISMFIRCVNSATGVKVDGEVQDHPMFLDEIQRQQELLEVLAEHCGLSGVSQHQEWFRPPAELACALRF
jgi:hypothetical protein